MRFQGANCGLRCRPCEQFFYYGTIYTIPNVRGHALLHIWSIMTRIGNLGSFRRALRASTAALFVLGSSTAAHAERVSVTGRAEAIIVTRLSLVKTDDLNFGKIVAGTAAGTVTVTPAGSRSATGGVRLAGTGAQPAAFSGYGFLNQTVSISVNSNTPVVRRVGGSETMQFDTFIIGSTPTAQLTTAPLAFRIGSTTGMFAFPVGATLRVKARQTPGLYTGSFSVTINYQ